MKNLIKPLIILAIVVSATACNNTNTESNDSTNHGETMIKLDGEKRWIANPETTDGINNMIQIVETFGDVENVESYQTLTDNLKEEFNTIFQKCTMEGEAHNQLHNYLFPMKEKFKLMSSDNLDDCKSAFVDLQEHLSSYKTYFE